MQYHASYTDGTTDTGIVDPASLPEHKRHAVAAVLDPDCTMYRMTISDPACFGTWDTDDVLGITPADRKADSDADDTGGEWPVAWSPAALRVMESPAALRDASESTFYVPPMPLPPSDTETFFADASAMYHATEAVRRQSEASSVLARCSRDLYNVLATLDADDDAAAFHAVRGEALTLASEASSLGWPLDGAGVPLPECRDECGA